MPRRDWILLPLFSLLTACLLWGTAELIARKAFTSAESKSTTCLVMNDPRTGVRGIPNSRCWTKLPEKSLPTVYSFNNCGYRAGMECGPKPPGVYRIVLVGSSFAMGLQVSMQQTFAALLPKELSRKTGLRIQLYNEGLEWGTPRGVDLRFQDALNAQPDMILWPVTPWDVEHASLALPPPPAGERDRKKTPAGSGLADSMARIWDPLLQQTDARSRAVFMLKHFLYQSQSQYVAHHLMQGEEVAFLKAKPDLAWRTQLQQFDRYVADVETKARAAGTPLIVTVLPEGVQAALISTGQWPAGLNPYQFGEQVRSIAQKHGGTYIDVLHGFRNLPDPEQYYYPMDPHPDAEGHKIFSELLAKALTTGAVPALNPFGEVRKPSQKRIGTVKRISARKRISTGNRLVPETNWYRKRISNSYISHQRWTSRAAIGSCSRC